jgi:hypothetical protein
VAESFEIAFPQGLTPAEVFMSATERFQGDDRVWLGELGSITHVASVGNAGLELGSQADARANVYNAGGVTFLRSQARVRGFARAAGAITTQEPVFIDGGQQPNTPVPSTTTRWTVHWPAVLADGILLEPDQPPAGQPPLPIAPGGYGFIDVRSRSRVALSSGSYFFNSFNTEPQAEVFVDTSAGPIFIYTREQFRYHGPFVQSGGEEGQILVGHLGTQNADLQVGFLGTMVAPNAPIDVRRPTLGQHRGAFFGKRIQVFSDAFVLHVPFDWGFLCPRGDSDADGVTDCDDVCFDDPQKTRPGVCGCGKPDTDADGDGVPDCKDQCPNDPEQQHPGDCGCASDPAPAGTACDDALCRGVFQCDGAGRCGTTEDCPSLSPGCQAKRFDNKWYEFCPGPASWDEAIALCRSRQVSLAQIDGEAENLILAKNMLGNSAWVGANDRNLNGQWHWARVAKDDGDRFWDGNAGGRRYFARYSAWSGGSPDGGDCGSMASDGSWSSAPCASDAGFVCEIPLERLDTIVTETADACEVLGIPCETPEPFDQCTPEAEVFGSLSEQQVLDIVEACNEACATFGSTSQECQDACAPLSAGTQVPCTPFSGQELSACVLASATDPLQACTSNAGCGAGTVCGLFFDPDACQGSMEGCFPTSAEEVSAGKVCGFPGPSCPTNDDSDFPAICVDTDLCEIDVQQMATMIESDGADLSETPFVPETFFAEPSAAPEDAPWPSQDNPCGAPCDEMPQGEGHPWCDLKSVEGDQPQGPPAVPSKAGRSDGNLVSFDFDPNFELTHKLSTGAFGIPEVDLAATASFAASVNLALVGQEFSQDLLFAEAGVVGDRCGIESVTSLEIFGRDFMPLVSEAAAEEGIELPFAFPNEDAQADCEAAFANVIEKANRVKKAYLDAVALMKQYRELEEGESFGEAFCEELTAQAPRGFPESDCVNESPERTINRFISYYEKTFLGFDTEDPDAAEGLIDVVARLAEDNLGIDAEFKLYEYGPKFEEITLFTSQFFIGPVPVNLELLATLDYGAKVTATASLRPGVAIKQALNGEANAAEEIAGIKVTGTPHAGAGVALFAGVGVSFGGVTAKVGAEGTISLGSLNVPAYAGAGVGLGTEIDERALPEDIAPLSAAGILIPKKRFVVDLRYTAGLGIKIRDILSGDIAGKIKVKLGFISRTYRKRLMSFDGFCSHPLSDDTGPPCDIDLVSIEGSSDVASGSFPWGSIRMEMPFASLARLPEPEDAGMPPSFGDATVDFGQVESFFFDSLCTCITDDPAEEKECFRNTDCCNPNQVCFEDPDQDGRAICRDCGMPAQGSTPGDSCNEDSDCCSGFCVDDECVPCLTRNANHACTPGQEQDQCCASGQLGTTDDLTCFTPLPETPGHDAGHPTCNCVFDGEACRDNSECCSGDCQLGFCGELT